MSQILVELQATMGSDADIANAAWTSTYDKARREDKYDDQEKVSKLVRQLILDGHGVPVESVIFRFWIRMPIITDRQFMTHRIASNSGLSGRYRTMPLDYYHLPEDVKDILNKGSMSQHMQDRYEETCKAATDMYSNMIFNLKSDEKSGFITNAELKRVREIIRGMLPTAGMVERTSIMNLRSFANFVRQRNSDHAQPEIRQVAKLMLEQVEAANIAPVAISTLKEIGWHI